MQHHIETRYGCAPKLIGLVCLSKTAQDRLGGPAFKFATVSGKFQLFIAISRYNAFICTLEHDSKDEFNKYACFKQYIANMMHLIFSEFIPAMPGSDYDESPHSLAPAITLAAAIEQAHVS